MRLCCIADEDTVRGFRLAGVAGQAVSTSAEALAALERAAADPACGLVILTEAVASGIRGPVERMRLERDQPLIVEIPGPQAARPGPDRLRRLVQEAVGLGVGMGA